MGEEPEERERQTISQFLSLLYVDHTDRRCRREEREMKEFCSLAGIGFYRAVSMGRWQLLFRAVTITCDGPIGNRGADLQLCFCNVVRIDWTRLLWCSEIKVHHTGHVSVTRIGKYKGATSDAF